MDFADGSMLDTTGGTCSMAGGSMASNWCKKKNRSKPQAMHKYPQEDSSQAMEDMVATRRQMDWRSRGSARPLEAVRQR